MNTARLVRWFSLVPYTDPVTRHRALSTYAVAVLSMLGAPIFYVPLLLFPMSRSTLEFGGLISLTVSALALYGASFSAINLTRAGQQRTGGLLLLILWAALIVIGLFNIGYPLDGLSLTIMLEMWVGLSLTVLLAGERALPFAVGLAILGIIFFGLKTIPPGEAGQPVSYLIPFYSLVLSSLLAAVGINWLLARGLRDTTQRANADAAKRLGLVEASSSMMQRILSHLDLDVLLKEIASLVRDNFASVEQVQVWLVEADRQNVSLAVSSAQDVTEQHTNKTGVGSLATVGRVTLSGEALLVRNLPTEQAYRREGLPPGINSQLMLPLKVASEVIGALEVQSQQLEAFGAGDIEVLQQLADQIAIAIDHARLYAAAQDSLNENRRLYEQTRSRLREIEQLNQQLTGQAWNEYLRIGTPAYTLDLTSGEVINAADWTPTLDQAVQTKRVVTHGDTHGKIVSLPIAVRGQVIGAMEFELDADQTLAPDQVVVMQQVIERLGLSVDNLRLLEEAQRSAQREATVNAISTRLQATTSVDSMIAAATQSLADAFQSSRVAIRLGALPTTEKV